MSEETRDHDRATVEVGMEYQSLFNRFPNVVPRTHRSVCSAALDRLQLWDDPLMHCIERLARLLRECGSVQAEGPHILTGSLSQPHPALLVRCWTFLHREEPDLSQALRPLREIACEVRSRAFTAFLDVVLRVLQAHKPANGFEIRLLDDFDDGTVLEVAQAMRRRPAVLDYVTGRLARLSEAWFEIKRQYWDEFEAGVKDCQTLRRHERTKTSVLKKLASVEVRSWAALDRDLADVSSYLSCGSETPERDSEKETNERGMEVDLHSRGNELHRFLTVVSGFCVRLQQSYTFSPDVRPDPATVQKYDVVVGGRMRWPILGSGVWPVIATEHAYDLERKACDLLEQVCGVAARDWEVLGEAVLMMDDDIVISGELLRFVTALRGLVSDPSVSFNSLQLPPNEDPFCGSKRIGAAIRHCQRAFDPAEHFAVWESAVRCDALTRDFRAAGSGGAERLLRVLQGDPAGRPKDWPQAGTSNLEANSLLGASEQLLLDDGVREVRTRMAAYLRGPLGKCRSKIEAKLEEHKCRVQSPWVRFSVDGEPIVLPVSCLPADSLLRMLQQTDVGVDSDEAGAIKLDSCGFPAQIIRLVGGWLRGDEDWLSGLRALTTSHDWALLVHAGSFLGVADLVQVLRSFPHVCKISACVGRLDALSSAVGSGEGLEAEAGARMFDAVAEEGEGGESLLTSASVSDSP
eukprot:TRINITY_DN8019_c0_g1_i2.p1 TRINITY_DN8019_c0_g1~~TRINITY_DN8019_c0_g1_i2.p1  ORF type:complete len:720 (+),score=136.93 TRINITY_DN8019_c0_g1_i2:88-2160(+)